LAWPLQRVRHVRRAHSIVVMAFLASGCGSAPNSPDSTETCAGFGDWQASPYVLPYAVGASYFVDQGNCSPPGNGHRGATRFGYDFLMPIGTPIHAARSGLVTEVEESHFDGQVAATGLDNLIVIQHDDGTTALYGHLTHDGAVVSVGDRVLQGALVGYSGNTGNTGNKPHLHLSAASCDPLGPRNRQLSYTAGELPEYRRGSAGPSAGTFVYGSRLLASETLTQRRMRDDSHRTDQARWTPEQAR
jgi:murein DD-endopeptidase MepM/ murein hydrolase activator NlpD